MNRETIWKTVLGEQGSKLLVTKPAELEILKTAASYAFKAACLERTERLTIHLYANVEIYQPEVHSTTMGQIEALSEHKTTRIYSYFKATEIFLNGWELRKSILVSWRNWPDLLVDSIFLKKWNTGRQKFWQLFLPVFERGLGLLSSSPSVAGNDLKRQMPKFVFVGFSIGGVYAVFAALAFEARFKIRPTVVTFGLPRIGNKYFAIYTAERVNSYRVTYKNDIIPFLPKNSDTQEFYPLKTEYWIMEDDCDCKETKVYKCYQSFYQDLNKRCSGRFISQVPRNFKEMKDREKVHIGPYFGYLMGKCPDIN
ncbi:hypothetical protein G9A89_003421 [Geosiphon pyriformis]|nr:hypothetical protein G9A89_003421 [Geosiphon pyriformis]